MSMDVIADAAAGPFAAACVVLAFAGVVEDPPAVAARSPPATALGLPASPVAVRTLGVVEIGAAAVGLAVGGVAALAVAVVYGALAVAAWRLLVSRAGHRVRVPRRVRRAGHRRSHVVVNVAAALRRRARDRRGRSPLAAVGTGIWSRRRVRAARRLLRGAGRVVLDALPALDAAVREGGADDRSRRDRDASCSCCSPSW